MAAHEDPAHAVPPGDMPPDELARYGREAIEWAAEYFRDVERYPVLPRLEPGDVAAALPAEPPEHGCSMDEILADFREIVVPGMTHWNHPNFHAYFSVTGSGPGVIADTLAAALNVNAMVWRSSPAATELEERTLDWLRQMMGLPEGFHGHIQDTASTSTLVALAAAREATGLGIREEGLAGRDLPRLRLYCSDQAHSSVQKGGLVLGLGLSGTRMIPSDAEFRMDPLALRAAIEEDLAAGIRPFCVVATVGTTSSTSIDPVPAIAALCEEFGLWLHVDAAYAGPAALLPEMRWILDGVERADSLVVNPHKWLFVQVDCSALYVRDRDMVRRAFSLVPEYLRTPEDERVTNLMDYGPALGRRFRSLKLWMVLRYFGREGIAARIREHIRIARTFASWVDAEPGWERLAPTPFSTLVMRYRPEGAGEPEIEAANQAIIDAVNRSGQAFLMPTRLHGRLAIRFAIGNIRVTERHVRETWEMMRTAGNREQGTGNR